MFWNCRCRACGSIVSIEHELDRLTAIPPVMICKQKLIKKCHPSCTAEIEPSESAVFDVISVSDEPLVRALDVYRRSCKKEQSCSS